MKPYAKPNIDNKIPTLPVKLGNSIRYAQFLIQGISQKDKLFAQKPKNPV